MSPISGALALGAAALATRGLQSASFTSATPPTGLVVPNTGDLTLFASWSGETTKVEFESAVNGLIPLTVVASHNVTTATCEWVKDEVKRFQSADDVMTDNFLEYIYLNGATEYEDGLAECLSAAYNTSAVLSCNASPETVKITALDEIVSGPYVAYIAEGTAALAKVYRVYRDAYQAFMSSAVPGPNSSFVPAMVNTLSDNTQGVAVPSRVYSLDADKSDKPFSGMRIGVKDIIDIKGLRTSMGNRAWFDVYGAAAENAEAMQTLIDLGASLVGKTKTAQFANNDRPTADWVDYHDAFNPRGDGYQNPGASSAGSGAAIAAYDWLDVAIGTDTGGSIRIPAAYNAIFGLRPTFDIIPVDGVLPEGPFFDAVGYHTRSPYTLQSFGKEWMGDKQKSYKSFPSTIHVPDDLFPVASDAAQEVYSEWLAKLQTFLDASIDTRNVSLLWSLNQTAPGHDQDFQDYLGEVGFQLEWWYQWNTAIEPFQEKYANTYDNRTAYINPTPKVRLDHYKNQTQATFDEARKRQLEFKEFFTTEVLKPDEDSCTTGLWVVPTNAGLVNPIDSYPYTAPTVNETALSFSSFYYSVFSSGGEVVIPIGQIPYQSDHSNHVEYAPVTVDLVARPGCDYVLLDLVAALADAGLVHEVKAGRTAF